MTETDPVVIVAAARTPIGGFQGDFKDLPAARLGAVAAKAALARSGVQPQDIEELILGCVLPAGQGQAPARQAALAAGFPESTPCTTVNKMCGSGMKAIMLAHDILAAGSARIALAGGMESMTNAPYLLDRARSGYRMGHGKILDHMFVDGLEDAYGARLADGRLRGGLRGKFSIHPCRPRCVRRHIFGAGAKGDQRRQFRKGNRDGRGQERQKRRVGDFAR